MLGGNCANCRSLLKILLAQAQAASDGISCSMQSHTTITEQECLAANTRHSCRICCSRSDAENKAGLAGALPSLTEVAFILYSSKIPEITTRRICALHSCSTNRLAMLAA
jgi:hypothetical protein